MLIEITYNVTDVYMSTTETPVYVEISFEQPGGTSAVWGSITGTLSNQTDLQNALNAKFDDPTGTTTQYIDGTGALQTFPLTLPVLQEVRNQTGATLDAGTVVYINGATGNKPTVTKAIATGDATSAQTLGMISAAIANNGVGYVVVIGTCGGLDTSAYTEGQQLYLSGTVAGGVTTTKPYAPIHLVYVGIVTRAHPNLGTIEVRVQNGIEVDEIHNVSAQTPSNNDGLFYNTSTSLWESKSITTALGYTPVPTTRNITINGVTYDLSADRTYTISTGISGSGAAGQVTYWTGASAVSGSNNFTWDNAIGLLTVKSENSAAPVRGILNEQYNNGVQAAAMVFRKARGTIASPANVLASDLVGAFSFSARVGGAFTSDRALFGANMATSTGIGMYFIAGSTDGDYAPDLYIHPTGNVVVNGGGTIITGGVTDGGQKFQVYGDTLLRGSGNTSATTALTVQNSSSTDALKVRNDGVIILGSSTFAGSPSLFPHDRLSPQSLNISGTGLSFNSPISGQSGTRFSFGSQFTSGNASGTNRQILSEYNITDATGGTATYTNLTLSGTISQTGGSNGITRGLYVNPTLTAAADFRAIETTAGNVLIGWNQNAATSLTITNTTSGTASNANLTITSNNGSFQLAKYSPLTTNYKILLGNDSFIYNNVSGDIAILNDFATGRIKFAAGAVSTSQMTLFANGNLAINSGVTDLGYRLGVVGDTLLRGSGATNATTALTVQNSSSTNLFSVRNDGAVAIGSASYNDGLRINRNPTTASASSIFVNTAVQTSVNTIYRGIATSVGLFGSGFTLPNLSHFECINDGSFTAGVVTNLYGFRENLGTYVATNVYGFYGAIPAASGRWSLYMAGSADNYLAGRLGLGSTALTNTTLRIGNNITGASSHFSVFVSQTVLSDVANASIFTTEISTQATSFTLNTLRHYRATQGTFGASSIVSNQYGFFAESTLTDATNNYGFWGDIASGTGRWNLYMNGTADNYLAGNLGIGITPTVRLQVSGDTILRGSGATSATTALTVQNSSSQNIITIKNNRTSNIISDAGQLNIASSADGTNGLMEFDANSSNTQTVFVQLTRGTVGFASTAINQTAVRINGGFAPTSGTATWHSLHVNPTINQTGGANGITRGLYVNPTLTSAADFRAIETTNGKIIFGNLPTSSAGLPTGALWNNGGVINIV